MKRSFSLRRRLLVLLTLAMLVAGAVNTFNTLDYVDHEAREVLDARLSLTGRHLLYRLAPLLKENKLNDAWLALETVRGLENAWVTKFSEAQGLLAFDHKQSSANGEPAVYIWLLANQGELLLGQEMPGFKAGDFKREIISVQARNREWRVLQLLEKELGYRLFVAQRDDVRKYLSAEVSGKLLERQLLMIPLVVFVLWIGIFRGLRPLSVLSSQVRNRKPRDLQPVTLNNVPEEILPLLEAINQLLASVRKNLDSERSFTSDAAHELRSPLSALRNLSQVIAGCNNLEEVHQATALLDQSTMRMSALLTQLLNLARLDHLEQKGEVALIPLRTLLEELAAEWLPVALGKNMEINFVIRQEALIIGNQEMLVLMLGNLLSNAVKYGSSHVEVKVERQERSLLLMIRDDGPGVDDDALTNLFDRFYRTVEAREKLPGSGLGLSIVRRVVELHGFDISAENCALGGMAFRLLIPPSRWQGK